MGDGTSGHTRCEVCGVPLRRDNMTGVCGSNKKPACVKARLEKRRQGLIARPSTKPAAYCTHPDGWPSPVYGNGLCNMHGARLRRHGEVGGAEPQRIRISPGDIFSNWTALEAYSLDRKKILCRCACGTERRVLGSKLSAGVSLSCGCLRPRLQRKAPYIAAGTVFERLTVLEDVRTADDAARVLCSCGTEKTVNAISVKSGHARSCGCLRREMHSTHGLTAHPLYPTWKGVIGRTTNPKDTSFARYGGRGVKICDRWLAPAAFIEDIEEALGPRPEGCTLDRIDVDGNYEPGNVRWADWKTQAGNRRSVTKLTCERDALAARVEELEARLQERFVS